MDSDRDDDGDDGAPGAATPSPTVLAAFRSQATPELYQAAYRHARQWAELPRRAGRRLDPLYARALVQDALADTWVGSLRWDPERQSLLQHVRDAIRTRCWNDARHARRFPHLPWHGAVDDDDLGRLELEVLAAHRPRGDAGPGALVGLITSVASALRRLAGDDGEAGALLDCWAVGLVERDEVMARTGLTAAAYKAARRRLLYLVKDLPPELCDQTRDLLRSA